jgi:hypothetical protein
VSAATVRVNVKVPDPPNFLRLDNGLSIAVQDMDDKALRQIGKQWTALLLLKARNKRRAA